MYFWCESNELFASDDVIIDLVLWIICNLLHKHWVVYVQSGQLFTLFLGIERLLIFGMLRLKEQKCRIS